MKSHRFAVRRLVARRVDVSARPVSQGFAATLMICAALASGCVGDLPSDEQIDEKVDSLVQGDIGVLDATSAKDAAVSDAGPGESDAPPSGDLGSLDGLDEDVADDIEEGDECITDTDCVGVSKGTSACRVPRCEQGFCSTKQLAKDTPCAPLVGAPTECEQALCTSTGECTIQDKPKGTACGPYKCGKQCAAGKCDAVGPEAYDDGNPCTSDYCKDGNAVVHDPITDVTGKCDDGDVCTESGFCFDGKCEAKKVTCDDGNTCTVGVCKTGEGCKFLPNDSLCDDKDPCTLDVCDVAAGCAVDGFAAATVTCDDGSACTKDDHCGDKGTCTGTAICACKVATDCAQGNPCLGTVDCKAGKCVVDASKAVQCDPNKDTACEKNSCDAKTGQCGLKQLGDGSTCDDGSVCTSKSACSGGQCIGKADTVCDDNNPCTKDVCDAAKGCTKQPIDGGKCDDKNACTSGDVCAKGGCGGSPKDCDDGVACTADSCDKLTGKCASKPQATACDDGNPCTTGMCDAKKGCQSKANDKGACDDGNACTKDACKGGKCIGVNTCECKSAKDCNDGNPCTIDTCTKGTCTTKAVADKSKVKCSTGDKCQQPNSGVCTAGVCASGNKPKNCSKLADTCNLGVCDVKTGACVKKPKTEGAPCFADQNGCTVKDFCKAGKCVPGLHPDCGKSSDPCFSAGCASLSKSKYKCTKYPHKKGHACDDGKFCTLNESCDGKGKCAASSSRSCAEVADVCNSGFCDAAASKCVKKPKGKSAKCSDGNQCTQGDYCSNGKCASGKLKSCPAGGTCSLASCDVKSGQCGLKPKPSGAVCDDGNKCTSGEKCDGKASCKGGTTAPCKLKAKACQTQFCNPLTGGCQYEPIKEGTGCDDGQKCTKGDKCDAWGQCQSGVWDNKQKGCKCKDDKDCIDGNQCTKDKCDNGECENKIDDGEKCDDGSSCTTESKCNKSGSCVATKSYTKCNDQANACNTATCDGSGALPKCIKTPKDAGATCDDGKWCTQSDACSVVGVCVGSNPRVCNDNKKCTIDTCDNAKKKCSYDPVKCDDNNPCTLDKCYPNYGCYGTHNAEICNDGDPCTYDKCNPADGLCSYTKAKDGAYCIDSNPCTYNQCKSGKCLYSRDKCVGAACYDNTCTVKTSSNGVKYGQCSIKPKFGATCSDNNKCTANEKCVKYGAYAKCAGGTKVQCDDKNPCTIDYCNYKQGCLTKAGNNNTKCDDGDKCTVIDRCKSGKCKGTTRTCDDRTPCTADSCDGATGLCKHTKADVSCTGPACKPNGVPACHSSSDPCLKATCKQGSGPNGSAETGYTCVYTEKCANTVGTGG